MTFGTRKPFVLGEQCRLSLIVIVKCNLRMNLEPGFTFTEYEVTRLVMGHCS